MKWDVRPREHAHLYNPAFAALCLAEAVHEYGRTGGRRCPWAKVFLFLPLAFDYQVRRALPQRTNARLNAWVASNPGVRVGLAERIAFLRRTTKEGLLYAMANGRISVDTSAEFYVERRLPVRHANADSTSEVRDIVDASAFIGRWFSKHETLFIFEILGLRP